jgi:CMP-N,N'-diacetyllegionaminic acid synthase
MLKDGTPVYALIPARGGSKGILKKNLKVLAGRPLIEYAINASKDSELVDEIWVSSDDQEILNFSIDRGVNTLLRPSNLATDDVSAIPVVLHFIEQLPNTAHELNAFILYLQPTSPLRTSWHIDESISQMLEANLFSVMSIVEAEKSPFKAFKIDDGGKLISLFDERLSNARRQDLPSCFYPNGAIYGFRISEFMARDGFPSNGSYPYLMSRDESVDIDVLEDLEFAEKIIQEKNG